MLIKLNPMFNLSAKEIFESMVAVETSVYDDYGDYIIKYGEMSENKAVTKAHLTLLNYHEGIGVLLRKGLVDIDLVYEIYASDAVWTWEKMLPFVLGVRRKAGSGSWENAEYLYNEMRRLHDAESK